MEKKRILYISHEMSPFLEHSDVSKISKKLPTAIQNHNCEIRAIMPRFGIINERRNRLHEVIRLLGMNIVIKDADNPLIIKVASIQGLKMQIYFIDNEDFFQRKAVFRDGDGTFFQDNDERMIFFCKGVIETIKKLGWAPDIIHCNDWFSSLIPLYLKTTFKNDPIFAHTKIIYSVFDNKNEEELHSSFVSKAIANGLNNSDFDIYGNGKNEELHLGAINHADAVVLCTNNPSQKVKEAIKDKPNTVFLDAEDDETLNEVYNENLINLYESLFEKNYIQI